jgi:hypothetical protein
MDYHVSDAIDRVIWDRLVEASPQHNIFCTTAFLDTLDCPYDLLTVMKDDCPWLGAVVVKGQDGSPAASPHVFSLYHGLIFCAEYSALPPHRRVRLGIELTEILIAACTQRYCRFAFSLHHSIEDLRAFQWFNYHGEAANRINLQLAYTGLICLDAFDTFDAYLGSVRQVKQQEYRRAAKFAARRGSIDDIEVLANLHMLTFNRQGLSYDPAHERLLRSITRAALERGFGELLIYEIADGDAAAATLFLHDRHTAYYLFGANHPDHRKTGAGTFLTLEGIRGAFEKGLPRVDMVGINSPNRGDYKTSLNAVPVSYFTASWTRHLLEAAPPDRKPSP